LAIQLVTYVAGFLLHKNLYPIWVKGGLFFFASLYDDNFVEKGGGKMELIVKVLSIIALTLTIALNAIELRKQLHKH